MEVSTDSYSENCGWMVENNQFKFQVFDGPQLLSISEEVLLNNEDTKCKLLKFYIRA